MVRVGLRPANTEVNMNTRKQSLLLGTLVCAFLLACLVSPLMAQTSQTPQDKTMWCTMTNAEFHKLCQNREFMEGLTPEQKKEIDKEWQRRIPTMTPDEIKMYYPEGTRYYTGS